ncbi:MAG: hypothetical protein K0S07_1369 [Chlamydiales bacterium]|jgi:hypothetical protein|nr:hypothetical protein [Chlamydiales bacterium]
MNARWIASVIFTVASLSSPVSLEANAYQDFREMQEAHKLLLRLRKVSATMATLEVVQLIQDLKSFAEKKCRHPISYEELYGQFFDHVAEKNLPVTPEQFEPLYQLIIGAEYSGEIERAVDALPFQLVMGYSLVFAAPLVAEVGASRPSLYAPCYTLTLWMLQQGDEWILEGRLG